MLLKLDDDEFDLTFQLDRIGPCTELDGVRAIDVVRAGALGDDDIEELLISPSNAVGVIRE